MAKDIKYIFFDTEMSGCEQIVSLGYVVTDGTGEVVDEDYYVIRPHKKIRKSTIAIHGITTEQAKKEGIPLKKGLAKFMNAAKECQVHVGFAPHNDILALSLGWKFLNMKVPYDRGEWTIIDVARLGTPFMLEREKILEGQTPSLSTLYTELFDGETYEEHNALSDAKATAKCFWKLMNDGRFTFHAIVPHSKIHKLCEAKPFPKTKPNAAAEPSGKEAQGGAPYEPSLSSEPVVEPIPHQDSEKEVSPAKKRKKHTHRRHYHKKKVSKAASGIEKLS